MGGGGGLFGGSQPSAPTLDYGASKRLTEDDLKLRLEYLPRFSEAAGKASRREYTDNLQYGLGVLEDRTLAQRYEAAMPEEARRRAQLLGALDGSVDSGAEYNRLQRELQGAVGERAGMLTPEQQREAVQSARAAMAARGMATGSAGAAAEILNRDRFMQQRRAQDLNILGQSAQLANQERARQLATRQDAYNFGLASNPQMMAIGAGSPYANMTAPAMSMVSNAQGFQPVYSGGSFGSSSPLPGMLGTLGGAALGAAGVALAPATFGTSLLPAMAGGAAIGGGLGGMFNR